MLPITARFSYPTTNMGQDDFPSSAVEFILHTQVSSSINFSQFMRQFSSIIASLITTFVHIGVVHQDPTWTLSCYPLADHRFPLTSTIALLSHCPPTVHERPSPRCSIYTQLGHPHTQETLTHGFPQTPPICPFLYNREFITQIWAPTTCPLLGQNQSIIQESICNSFFSCPPASLLMCLISPWLLGRPPKNPHGLLQITPKISQKCQSHLSLIHTSRVGVILLQVVASSQG